MGKVRKLLISLQLHIQPLYLSTTKAPHKIDPSYVNHRQKIPSVFCRVIYWMGFFFFLGHFADHFGQQNAHSLCTFWKMKQPLLQALKHLLLFHFSFLMILGGYPSGIKGEKENKWNYAQAFMLSKALGKALNDTVYHNWAYAQLHLTRALIPVKPEVSCFTYIYLPGWCTK